MPRKKLLDSQRIKNKFRKRDPVYGSFLVMDLVNKVMWDGEKNIAMKLVYKAFELIEKETGENPLKVFERAVENTKPLLEVRPRRVGGATYQVPMEVPAHRGNSLSISWIVEGARQKEGKPFYIFLKDEIISASKKEGYAYKKREETHKMAEANRAFIHFRW